ncbi:hypothetical protein [Paraburkholderia sp.]|jgi:hypothetical protein|uniref:hypothetical protein n=1 Tax=Paraburkholderia sp. TaxID=1926495 RepID=UPI0011CDE3B1|nr:hypothetical protein [Paraburkholderia sp.]
MKHRFQVNSFEVKALVIPIATANDELGAHFSTGGHWCCNHAWRGCVNASTEWRSETLVKENRSRNRLAGNPNRRGYEGRLIYGIGANTSGAYASIFDSVRVLSEQHPHGQELQQKSYGAPTLDLVLLNRRYINAAGAGFPHTFRSANFIFLWGARHRCHVNSGGPATES